MKAIAERSFGTGDVPALMQRLRTDRQYLFRSRAGADRLLEGGARARAAAPRRSGSASCRRPTCGIEPYPAFREKSGAPDEYNPPSEDGSRPAAVLHQRLRSRRRTTRADNESTAFHETIPGHHLQVAIALERKRDPSDRPLHLQQRLRRRLGAVRRAARRRDEAVLGGPRSAGHAVVAELARRAAGRGHRPARARLDAAAGDRLHARAHAAVGRRAPRRRWIATSSGRARRRRTCSGMLEIRRRARGGAARRQGTAFDIKAFHDRVLEDGAGAADVPAGEAPQHAR